MLRLKQAELELHLLAEKERLSRVEVRIKQIEQENNMSNYEVVLKTVQPIKVASIREILPTYSSIGRLYEELSGYFKQQGVKPNNYCAGVWHELEYKESDVDGEAVMSPSAEIIGNERIKFYELPAVETMACLVYNGSYNSMNPAFKTLLSWIEANGYKIIGSNREVYIVGGNELDNDSFVTEIQFPVSKA